jgi:hypothetical protein
MYAGIYALDASKDVGWNAKYLDLAILASWKVV